MDHLHRSKSDAVRHRTGFLMVPSPDGGWMERWWVHDRGGRTIRKGAGIRLRHGFVKNPHRKKFARDMKFLCVRILFVTSA